VTLDVSAGVRRARCLDGREDFFFHENSHLYPVAAKLREPLKQTHEVVSIVASGIMLGFPYNRPRSYACGFDRSKFVWAGQGDPQTEFEHLFVRSVQLTGDVYFLADDDEVRGGERGVHPGSACRVCCLKVVRPLRGGGGICQISSKPEGGQRNLSSICRVRRPLALQTPT
jgi:hypothetical protein